MLIQIKAAEREATGEPLQVEFYGEIFTVDAVNQFALMKMAGAEADGEMAVLSAFWGFLKTLIVADDWDRFEKLCMARRVGLAELQPLIQGIAEAITARFFQSALRLAGWAATHWDACESRLALAGHRPPFGLTPRVVLNVVYAMLIENRDDKERKQLDALLDAPLTPLTAPAAGDGALRRGAVFAGVGKSVVVR